jgi:hypothetical protein
LDDLDGHVVVGPDKVEDADSVEGGLVGWRDAHAVHARLEVAAGEDLKRVADVDGDLRRWRRTQQVRGERPRREQAT